MVILLVVLFVVFPIVIIVAVRNRSSKPSIKRDQFSGDSGSSTGWAGLESGNSIVSHNPEDSSHGSSIHETGHSHDSGNSDGGGFGGGDSGGGDSGGGDGGGGGGGD